jgi:hypothetical protein
MGSGTRLSSQDGGSSASETGGTIMAENRKLGVKWFGESKARFAQLLLES